VPPASAEITALVPASTTSEIGSKTILGASTTVKRAAALLTKPKGQVTPTA
jgi:hypothetical protein